MSKVSRSVRLLGVTAAVAAGVAAQSVSAQVVTGADEKRGTAVFAPYYTVNEGGGAAGGEWRTLLNITNVEDTTLAVKVRLHEHFNSRDVLDFVVLLSPYDAWSAVISRGNDGRPRVTTPDRSCTVPIKIRDDSFDGIGGPFAVSGVQGVVNPPGETGTVGRTIAIQAGAPSATTLARTSEGYVEVLVMGELDEIVPPSASFITNSSFEPGGVQDGDTNALDFTQYEVGDDIGNIAYYIKHVQSSVNNNDRFVVNSQGQSVLQPSDRRAGDPRNCYLAEEAFLNLSPDWAGGTNDIPGDEGSGDPAARAASSGNNLVDVDFGFDVIDSEAPLSVNLSLINPTAGVGGGVESTHYQNWGLGENLVAAQVFPFNNEPTLASRTGLWTVALGQIRNDIAFSEFFNEWATNPNTGASTDWVVTFPDKRFDVDFVLNDVFAGCSGWRSRANTTGAGGAGVYQAIPSRNDCNGAGAGPGSGTDTVFPSAFSEAAPLTGAPIRIRYTVRDREEQENVVTVEPSPGNALFSNLPYETNVVVVGPQGTPSIFGTFQPQLVSTDALPPVPAVPNNGWVNAEFLDDANNPVTYAVTGFLFKLRDFGTQSANFGQATIHGYRP
ncbi:hypothetical protein [Algiphilus sp.]|uniref:hypothetical protein n=1 Tax=Algiphilus sp. TaxID=1872431 RepID=UPI0032EF63A8